MSSVASTHGAMGSSAGGGAEERILGYMSSRGKAEKGVVVLSSARKPQQVSWYRMAKVAGESSQMTKRARKLGIMPRSLMMGIPRMVLTVMSLPRPKDIWMGLPSLST